MSCGKPPNVANANFSSVDNLYGDTVDYICDPGFGVTGSVVGIDNWSITCQSNATWTSGETCSSKDDFTDLTNKLIRLNFSLRLYTNGTNGIDYCSS